MHSIPIHSLLWKLEDSLRIKFTFSPSSYYCQSNKYCMLTTSVYSKPTDTPLYLNATPSHRKSEIMEIVRRIALRLRRICSDYPDYQQKSKE